MSTDSKTSSKSPLSTHSIVSSPPEEPDPSSTDIDYWSRSFLALVYPVSFTVIISAGLALFLYDLYTQSNVFEDAGLISSSHGPNAASLSQLTWESFKIALIIIGVLALATCLLVLLVYFGCMKFLYVYLFITVLSVFSLLNLSILSIIVAQLNSAVDWITVVLYVYNILIVAIVSMFWLSPDLVKQMVTIYQCVIMILYVLKIAPEWIAWMLLPLLAIWDMIAVLLPFGPLYLLINLFQKRELQVPSMMIYTTGMWTSNRDRNSNAYAKVNEVFALRQWSILNLLFPSDSTLNDLHRSDDESRRMRNTNASSDRPPSKKRPTRKSMLGLGDFIFYSILLAKTVFTSECNLFAIIIVYLCIIMGMLATTIVLVILHRPLPALPFSLFIGLAVFFQYNYIGDRFADALRLPTGPMII